MSVLRASNASLGLNSGKPVSTYDSSVWEIPSDWVSLPTVLPTEQKVVGSVAIYDQGSNWIAFNVTTTDGSQYTVDWGDGTSANFASGATAEKNYTWSSISSGTLTSRNYRQAIITITPTIAGRTFSALQLSRKNTALTSNTATTNPWLNLIISAPNATVTFAYTNAGVQTNLLACRMLESIQILSSNITNASHLFRGMNVLQNIVFNSGTLTNATQMFSGCNVLSTAPFFDTSSLTNASYMFENCVSLSRVPLYNTASVTDMNNMFNGCKALKTVPLFNTASVISMSNMFYGCSDLTTVPLFNTASVTSMGNMFNGCSSLIDVPLFNTTSVTDMSLMFASCFSLKTVPLFNTASVTNMGEMFTSCNSLETVPVFNTSSVNNFPYMFQNCLSLREIPELNVSNASYAFPNELRLGNSTINFACASLGRAKLVGNKFTQTFQNCRMAAAQLDEMYTALAILNPPITNVSGSGTAVTYTVGPSAISPFIVGRSVTITGVNPAVYNISGTITGINTVAGTFQISNSATGAYVSGGVATCTSDRTITVTGNPGTATDNPAIATAKGWTVTG